MDQEVAPSDAEVISAYHSGTLLPAIFGSRFQNEELCAVCVRLHNSSEIDLLSLIDQPEFQAIEGFRFFSGQQLYCQAIPELSASVESMMHAVQILVQKGGQDGAAGFPNLAFEAWCKRDPRRAHEVLAGARGGDTLAIQFVTFALTSANSAKEAREFASSFTDNRRLHGITALGRMKHDGDEARAALSFLFEVANASPSASDDLQGCVIRAASAIAEQASLAASTELHEIIRVVCRSSGASVHYFCACSLYDLADKLSKDSIALILQALASFDPRHKGTLDQIDVALSKLLQTSCADQAVDFVANILSSAKGALSLQDFDSFGRKLVDLPSHEFGRVFVKWMMMGDHVHREGLSRLVRHANRSETPIEFEIEGAGLGDSELVFLCRKTIGYFFLQPIWAGSVLVSVLRCCSENAAEEVGHLLFDPLLLNFGAKLADYLGSIEKNDRASIHVAKALERKRIYLDDLKDLPPVKELLPSERQRQMERTRLHEEMRVAHKKAERKSVLVNLVSRINLLHGKRATTYVQEADGTHRWVEIELKGHSVQIELPRMEMLDTIGLEFKLTIFRAERFRP